MSTIFAVRSSSTITDTNGRLWQVFETSPAPFGEGASYQSTWHAYSRDYQNAALDGSSYGSVLSDISSAIRYPGFLAGWAPGLKARVKDDNVDFFADNNGVRWTLVDSDPLDIVQNPKYVGWSFAYNFGKGVLVTSRSASDRFAAIQQAAKEYKATMQPPPAPPAAKVPEGPPPPPKDPSKDAPVEPALVWYYVATSAKPAGTDADTSLPTFRSSVWRSAADAGKDDKKAAEVVWAKSPGGMTGMKYSSKVDGYIVQVLQGPPFIGDGIVIAQPATVPVVKPKPPSVTPTSNAGPTNTLAPVARVSSSSDMSFGLVVGVGLLAAWGISRMRGKK